MMIFFEHKSKGGEVKTSNEIIESSTGNRKV